MRHRNKTKSPASKSSSLHAKPYPRTKYQSGGHTKHRLRYHLVWVPKYRKRVLEADIALRLEHLLREACEVNRWQLQELAIQPDHVHLLLQIDPDDRLSDVIHCLKGGTSYSLRAEFPKLKEHLWGAHFWATGYFAETMGRLEEDIIRKYIRDQQL